jgi:hypothetical protein
MKKDVGDIVERYCIKDRTLVPRAAELIFSKYDYEDYSGSSSELFVKNGVLYENHGSHCSCYGLEDQWKPEVTYLEAIKRRPEGFGGVKYKDIVAVARAAGYNGR